MQSSLTRRPRLVPRSHLVTSHAVSGRHPRAFALNPTCEEFDEPYADLADLDEPDPKQHQEIARLKVLLQERDLTIRALEETLAGLQRDRSKLISQLGTPAPGQEPASSPIEIRSLRRVFVKHAAEGQPEDCVFQIEFDQETIFYSDLTEDISRGGVVLSTYRALPLGSTLELTFELDDGTPLEAIGRVHWYRDGSEEGARPGIGVAFVSLTAATLAGLRQVCRGLDILYIEL